MNDEIVFDIPGDPIGKGRARSFVRGIVPTASGKQRAIIGHYTPEKTRTWEGVARTLAMEAMRGRQPFAGPVRLALHITFAVPDSWPAWKRAMALNGEIEPTIKPDKDNIEKAVKDACNAVVWHDDCQVTAGVQLKKYGEHPGVRVCVMARNAYPAQLKKKPKGEGHAE